MSQFILQDTTKIWMKRHFIIICGSFNRTWMKSSRKLRLSTSWRCIFLSMPLMKDWSRLKEINLAYKIQFDPSSKLQKLPNNMIDMAIPQQVITLQTLSNLNCSKNQASRQKMKEKSICLETNWDWINSILHNSKN